MRWRETINERSCMVNIEVIPGNITQTGAKALIAPVNSYGYWAGGIDKAIQHWEGLAFHNQIAKGCRDGDTILTSVLPKKRPRAFERVLFVIDDLKQPLGEIVRLALARADQERLESVTMPLIRTGATRGIFKTAERPIEEMAEALKKFKASTPRYLRRISVIIPHNDPRSAATLRRLLKAA